MGKWFITKKYLTRIRRKIMTKYMHTVDMKDLLIMPPKI